MLKCTSCDASVPDNAKFCSNCGSKVGVGCVNCGAVLKSDDKFCSACGAQVETLVHDSKRKLVSFDLNTKNQTLDINILSVTATGPNAEGDFEFGINLNVINNGSSDIALVETCTQIFTENGILVAETYDSFEENIPVDGSAEFQTTIWGVKSELFGNDPSCAQTIVSATGSLLTKDNIFIGGLLNDSLDAIPIDPQSSNDQVNVVCGSYWKTKPDESGDVSIESKILLQNRSDLFYPRATVYMDIIDQDGEVFEESSSSHMLEPYGVASGSIGLYISSEQINTLPDRQVRFMLGLYEQCAVGLGEKNSTEIIPADVIDTDDSNLKSIYIKTEPGGRVMFGALSEEQHLLLDQAVANKKMSDELLELTYNSSGLFSEYEGIFNQGQQGDFGHEGHIVIDSARAIELPVDESGRYVNGAYLVYLLLSKVSIEFEFSPSDGKFDSNKFEEVSIPVKLPDCVKHELYGHPDYNIVIDYLYDGEPIEEYDRNVVDRGYDSQIIFLVVKDGKVSVEYSNYNGNETWGLQEQQS